MEDWFHTENMKSALPREEWDRCELRVERNTMRMLEILHAPKCAATFFVLGWVAEKCPQLVRTISAAGHEMASHGYGHDLVYSLQPREFRADILRSRGLLEDLTGTPVRGYRAPCFSITDWAIPILQDAGFDYDFSVVPTIAHDRYGRLHGLNAANQSSRSGTASTKSVSRAFDLAGVAFHGAEAATSGSFHSPLVPGVHDPAFRHALQLLHPSMGDRSGQPRVSGLRASIRFRHRINLHRCEKRFAALVGAFAWMPMRDLVDEWKAKTMPAAAVLTQLTTVNAAPC